jgi:hypothetical protein
MTMSTARWRVPCLALALTLLGCEELQDPSFDLCAGEGCAWSVDEGSTHKVPTWNDYDEAIELVATPTTVSQLVDGPLDCTLDIELFGVVAKGAELTVAVDADDDGSIDDIAYVPELDWDSAHFLLSVSAESSWRLIVQKQGDGKVVLGTVSAERYDCL